MKYLAFVSEGKIEMILDETSGTDIIQEYVNKFKDDKNVVVLCLDADIIGAKRILSVVDYILSVCESYDKGLVQADNVYFNNVLITAIRA